MDAVTSLTSLIFACLRPESYGCAASVQSKPGAARTGDAESGGNLELTITRAALQITNGQWDDGYLRE
jgi:hypothetical protein